MSSSIQDGISSKIVQSATFDRASATTTSTSKLAKNGASKSVGSDGASISTTSARIYENLQLSDVRADRVAALRTAIQNGSYQVSSMQVADKLIDFMLQ